MKLPVPAYWQTGAGPEPSMVQGEQASRWGATGHVLVMNLKGGINIL